MTAYPRHAFDVAPGDPQPTVLTPLALFFRRALRLPWRKRPVPAAHPAAGAATPPDGLPVLRDRMLSDVRREYGAGLPTAGQMRREYFAQPAYGQAPVAALLAAERGLSFDCHTGLHAPVCDGRNCTCDCHRSAA